MPRSKIDEIVDLPRNSTPDLRADALVAADHGREGRENYATHKDPVVKGWLAKDPRFQLHFTLTQTQSSRK